MIAQRVAGIESTRCIRRFDLQRDLRPLAELIQVAFREELERSDTQMVAELLKMANAWPLLYLLSAFGPALSSLMSGYVWIADGRLVGNVTLAAESKRRGLWAISNVAVHPEYRGHGIARQLMQTALEEARDKDAHRVVLQVQTDNVPAQRLYGELGFRLYDTVVELRLPTHARTRRTVGASVALRKRRAADKQNLYDLFKAATPIGRQLVRPVLLHHYRWGTEDRLGQSLDNLLNGRRRFDRVLEVRGRIVALLQVTGHYTRTAHRLRITVHPNHRGTVEGDLVDAGCRILSRFPLRDVASTVSTAHPEALQALQKTGFRTGRELDQMLLDLDTAKRGTS